MIRRLTQLLLSEEAATSVEYAVMLSLIAGLVIASVLQMSNATAQSFDNSAGLLGGALGS